MRENSKLSKETMLNELSSKTPHTTQCLYSGMEDAYFAALQPTDFKSYVLPTEMDWDYRMTLLLH